ncbi:MULTISPECIES: metal ABC transporter permease [Sporosarcina]|uniref:metal ABC transporter permease n=1 Tax=Sporosarcina TaxID=1569 RepID=UPI000694EB2A|nr:MULTISPECIES: metal ABC transporter permease [Sporosarcina]WJY27567.1 metal ABC transporter permease [Sporosarcina sp. 0.2-SM1T-5]
MFELVFMQRALAASLLIALISPLIGVFLIMRNQSLIADTLSHIALAGVAVGLLLGDRPGWISGLVVVLGALLIEYLRTRYRSYSDVSIAIMMAAGLSIALCLMTVMPTGTKTMNQYLFGSIVTVTQEQLVTLLIMSGVIGLYFLVAKRSLYRMVLHEDIARAAGIRTKWLSFSFSAVIGLFISTMIPMTGMLLVSAIIILPSAAAMQLTSRFRLVFVTAGVLSILCSIAGLVTSYTGGTPPGASIALWMVAAIALILLGKKKVRRPSIVR